jgi:hypothetical protein
MLQMLFRGIAVVVVTASFCLSSLPARANGNADVYEQVIMPSVNDAIKTSLDQQRQQRHKAAANTVAQAPPVSQEPVGQQIGLPNGIGYFADVSTAYPYGNIGSLGKGWLMGGMDGSVTYTWRHTWRVQASVYQLQHWPYGFNSGKVPVYLQGFRNPVGCADLGGGNGCGAGTGQNINVRTKDTFGVFLLSKLFLLGGFLPVVISPTYVARGSEVGESPNNNDKVPFSYNPPDGPVLLNTPTRTAQFKSVAITIPILKTPKMFGTFTVAPQWLIHTSGVNTFNTMQLPQILYLEYTPTKSTTIFFEPQSARDYLPTDPYPEHLIAYFLGISQHLTKNTFAQVVLNSGGPTNMGPDGILSIKCLTASTATCGPTIGGLKATQVQFMLGIGSPSVFPL